MQKFLIYITLLLLSTPVFAQQQQRVKALRVMNNLGTMQTVEVDTIPTNFQHSAPQFREGIAVDFFGNLGSPLQSKEFFRRENRTGFLFAKPYEPYLKTATGILFYDTRTPFSNVSYFFGGPSNRGEDRLTSLFSVNVNPKLNFGFTTDYIYGRGVYMNQSTNHFLASIFGSYRGERYSMHTSANFNNLRNFENGGIANTEFITNPGITGNLRPENMEVNLNNRAVSKLYAMDLMYHHRYVLGVERIISPPKEREQAGASNSSSSEGLGEVREFVPVTTFAHTLRFESYEKTYSERTTETPFYERFSAYNNTFLNAESTRDVTRQRAITNVFSVSLNEEFNRFMRFGLTAFMENKHLPYRFIKNGEETEDFENNTAIGGVLSKYLGREFLYDVTGKITLAGRRAGDFDLSANIWSNIPIAGDSVLFSAGGFISNTTPNFFWEHYQSNRVQWSNSFDRQFRTRLQGKLNFPSWKFNVQAQVENVNNHLYFNRDALPAQASNGIQIVALGATKNFQLGNFHFEHDGVYQLTSDKDVIPLPTWLLRANWYYKNRLFKVLLMQLGAEVRYFSKYYAPSYMPVIGQFFVQNEQKVGNYPFVDLYANFHLKRARFFVKYSHANFDISEPNYFLIPNYPANPSMTTFGLSWNFYD